VAAQWADSARRADLPPVAVDFLDAGLALERERQRREAAAAEAARRRARRDRLVAVALAVLLVASLAGGAVALAQRQRAQAQEQRAVAQQRTATARGLTIQADALRATQPRLSLRLAIAATAISPDSTLTKALTQGYAAGRLPKHDNYLGAAFNPAGDRLAVVRDDVVELWNVADPDRPRRVASLRTAAAGTAFSGDGRILAVAGSDGIVLWSVDGDRPRRRAKLAAGTGWVSFGPAGRTLATLSASGSGRLWNSDDPDHPQRLGSFATGPVDTAWVSADGRFLATERVPEGSAGGAWLWDVTNPVGIRRIADLGRVDGTFADIAPGGRLVATISVPGDFFGEGLLWDVTDPSRPRKLAKLPVLDVFALAFSPDGHVLATSGQPDPVVVVWNVDNPAVPRRVTVLEGHTGMVASIGWSSDGRLVTVIDDETVRLWKVAPAAAIAADAVGEACRMAGGGLTPQQWAGYVPGLAYQQTCTR
jgi:hypothetical protein